MDSTWFGNNNEMLPGAEGALILYAAYIFTMFIVMSNIMVSFLNVYLFV